MEDFGITKVYRKGYSRPDPLDHVEMYRCHNGEVVFIHTPYMDADEFNALHGFKATDSRLYIESHDTYIRVFTTLQAMKDWAKSIGLIFF